MWHLPEISKRFEIAEPQLRRTLFEQTRSMFIELWTRSPLKVF
ncbi:hypothetical protein H6G86_21720 [Nostoc sp. FACHB-133]|nr:hypothetical protein [Nostoc sp. FACHB-133]